MTVAVVQSQLPSRRRLSAAPWHQGYWEYVGLREPLGKRADGDTRVSVGGIFPPRFPPSAPASARRPRGSDGSSLRAPLGSWPASSARSSASAPRVGTARAAGGEDRRGVCLPGTGPGPAPSPPAPPQEQPDLRSGAEV
ncbi:hypothetical protein FQA47_018298 [Oryzias melastigma]|uniref:Uncharacterized protein n=1 Tax=Oryzias melastigma TaxID=30732 RepID=A0A834L1A0_ORYME|nr:hypothetical protein FQA47_018298 [Oryzias melastigma]